MRLLVVDDVLQRVRRRGVDAGQYVKLLAHMAKDYPLNCDSRGGDRLAAGKPCGGAEHEPAEPA